MGWRSVARVHTTLAVTLLTSSLQAAEVTPSERDAVERFVRAQVGSGRSSDDQPVVEYAEARRILAGSGESKSASLLIAQYTIETGNSWQIYLAAFDRPSLRPLASARVGGKEYRAVTLASVVGGVINIDVQYYGKGEASCCPTIRGTSSFLLREGQLWETGTQITCGSTMSGGGR